MSLKLPTQIYKNRRYLLMAIILLILLYVVVPQLGDFRTSWHLLKHPNTLLLAGGLLFTGLTFVAGAVTYCVLAFRRLNYGQVLLIQLGAMFINRILPAGVGAVGANYAYLRHSRHSVAQAASVVAINNLIGFVGHGLIIVISLLFFSASSAALPAGYHPSLVTILIVSTIVITALLGALVFAKSRFRHLAKQTIGRLLSYSHKPGRLVVALICSMGLTMFNILSFDYCAQAVGVHLPLAVLVLVFTFGIGLGTATPTPGGLGGFETGLVVGMVAYHIASPLALSAALLYRLVSYWLPLLVGGPAFVICERRKLFKAS